MPCLFLKKTQDWSYLSPATQLCVLTGANLSHVIAVNVNAPRRHMKNVLTNLIQVNVYNCRCFVLPSTWSTVAFIYLEERSSAL